MKEQLKKIVRPFYYKVKHAEIYLLNKFFVKPATDIYQIPIIINNRNRYTTLKCLIEGLEERGYKNIHILDNDSTYEPLLLYYKNMPYSVHYLGKNLGFLALWKTDLFRQFRNSYYVYTDSDVALIEECPQNFLHQLVNKMQADSKIYKIGLSIKIDDLPDCYIQKKEVIEWESRFYEKKYSDGFYIAHVDTTFALYRPWYKGGANIFVTVLRSDYPLQIRHLPWYNNSNNLSEEELYYIANAHTITHWTSNN